MVRASSIFPILSAILLLLGGVCVASSGFYKSKRNIILGGGILFVAAGKTAALLWFGKRNLYFQSEFEKKILFEGMFATFFINTKMGSLYFTPADFVIPNRYSVLKISVFCY